MSKTKILLTLSLILVLISSYCFATDVEIQEEDVTTLTQEGVTEETPLVTTQDTQVTTADTTANTDNWVNGDLYKCEDNVTIDGIVDGNAFIIGKEVTITGEIGGDLFVMAQKVNIDNGYIYSNIFVLAEEFNLDGVAYDVYAACNTFNLKENGLIYRDLRLMASDKASLSGRIRRDAYIYGKNLNFNQHAGTIIYGNLEYYSDEAEYTAPTGVVAGQVKHTQNPTDSVETEQVSVAAAIGKIIWNLVKQLVETLAFAFVLTLLILWLAPNFIEKVTNMSVKKSFACLGIGLIPAPALILVGIILIIIAIIGIPLLADILVPLFFTGLWGYIFMRTLASVITSIFITKLLTKKMNIEGKVKFAGFTMLIAAGLWLIGKIPLIGDLVSILVTIFGLGAILVNILPKKETKAE